MVNLGWSDLPDELVDLIANCSTSNMDHIRVRSICKPWRCAIATKKRFTNHFERSLVPSTTRRQKFNLLPNTYFRVTQPSSSYPNKGWLLKTRQVSESSKVNLLSPLSNDLITPCDKTLDLLKYGVSETRRSYNVQFMNVPPTITRDSARAVFVDNHVFVVEHDKQIWHCKRGEESSKKWTKLTNGGFSDVIIHKGEVYALNLEGPVYRINLSNLSLSQYAPSTPKGNIWNKKRQRTIGNCKDKRLVEYCGDLCVVHRLSKHTSGFKVYKMDKGSVEWVEVKSLEDKAIIVGSDSCFTVLASEYHGCLKNAIYFSDNDDGYNKFRNGVKGACIQVFKLDDWSIRYMTDSFSNSCFEMFSSPWTCSLPKGCRRGCNRAKYSAKKIKTA